MQKVVTNGIEIAYQVQGKGDPLVLIAGVGYGAWFWHKVNPGLAEEYRVITFDNRGAGESSKPTGPYSVQMMAEDTASLLDHLELNNACILGHSLGGFIAQELAVSRPDLVGKLILASTNHGGMNVIPITAQALAVLTNREGDPLDLVKRGIEIACAPGFAEREPGVVQELIAYRFTNPVPPDQYQAQVTAGAGMAAFNEDQVSERMGSIRVPTLILFGEYDNVVPPGNAELMGNKITDARSVIIPATGHIFPIEDPEKTVLVIKEFLKDQNE